MDVWTNVIKETSSKVKALKRNLSIYFLFSRIHDVYCNLEKSTAWDPRTVHFYCLFFISGICLIYLKRNLTIHRFQFIIWVFDLDKRQSSKFQFGLEQGFLTGIFLYHILDWIVPNPQTSAATYDIAPTYTYYVMLIHERIYRVSLRLVDILMEYSEIERDTFFFSFFPIRPKSKNEVILNFHNGLSKYWILVAELFSNTRTFSKP